MIFSRSPLFEPPGLSPNWNLVTAAEQAMSQVAGTGLHGTVVLRVLPHLAHQ